MHLNAAIDDETHAYLCLDSADPDWRETLRDEIIATHASEREIEVGSDSDNDNDSENAPLPIPAKEPLDLARQLNEFADNRCWGELSIAVMKVGDILVNLRLKTQKQ